MSTFPSPLRSPDFTEGVGAGAFVGVGCALVGVGVACGSI